MRNLVLVLIVALLVVGGGIIWLTVTKKCPKCPKQEGRVPSLTSGPGTPRSAMALKPKKIIKPTPKPTQKGPMWKGQKLPTTILEVYTIADLLMDDYVRACKKKFRQGPIYKGYFGCIRWWKIHEEWLKNVDEKKNPLYEFWVRIVAQRMMENLGKAICNNDHYVSATMGLTLDKIAWKERKKAFGVLEQLAIHAQKNKKRFKAHLAAQKKGVKMPQARPLDLSTCKWNSRRKIYQWIQI